MARSKNEIKERRGMVVFIIAISLPIVLIGLFGLFFLNSAKQIGDSLAQLDHSKFPVLEEPLQAKEPERLHINLLGDQQRAVFTGIEHKGDTTYTYALQIQAIDSVSLKYWVERLVNWKSLPDISGIARFDTTSINSQQWQMEVAPNSSVACYRFVDVRSECEIELLFSKEDLRKSQAAVKKICGDDAQVLTNNLRHK